jgi:hypothetical protein
MNFEYYPISKNIKYVVNPETFIKDETQQHLKIRQLQLFCYNCNKRVNVTEENSKSFPPSLFALPIDKIIFEHSPLYGGICMRPECGKTIKYGKR